METTNNISNPPFVAIVGAGPGAPDLMTLKGFHYLQKAKAVLHDALIEPSILNFASSEATFIDVGKKYGEKSTPQNDINHLLVETAHRYGLVVRLKGGDPSIFGRLKEELEILKKNGIPYEIVPGISSSIGVLTDNGIPVTTRGVNESFIISTAAKDISDLEADIDNSLSSKATLVLLMSMSKLNTIQELYIQKGRPDSHAVIIQNGTMSSQKKVFCPVSKLSQTALDHQLKNPAIVAIGNVVNLNLGTAHE